MAQPKKVRRRHGIPRRLRVFKKSPYMRRWLLRNPWIRPITVFNYAATRIQAVVRRFIIRSRILRYKSPLPPKRQRKKISKPRQLDRYLSYLDKYTSDKSKKKPEWLSAGFSSWCAVRIQSMFRMHRFRRRFQLRTHLINQVAAIVLQTFWKNCRYQMLEHIASQSLHGEDYVNQHHHQQQTPHRYDSPNPHTPKRSAQRAIQREDHAAYKIQRCWRAFCNRRIFRYFRDLIVERLSAAPVELLRSVIPNEGAAFDRASGTHVRFRLGGWIFPPKIFYKIYTHRPLCDVGAFAPRDYTQEKPVNTFFMHSTLPSVAHVKTGRMKVGTRFFDTVVSTTNPGGTKDWYRREENNGWRPIASQIMANVSRPPWFQPEILSNRDATGRKPLFHYDSQYRKTLKAKSKMRTKKKWMQKFFMMSQRQDMKGDGEEIGTAMQNPFMLSSPPSPSLLYNSNNNNNVPMDDSMQFDILEIGGNEKSSKRHHSQNHPDAPHLPPTQSQTAKNYQLYEDVVLKQPPQPTSFSSSSSTKQYKNAAAAAAKLDLQDSSASSMLMVTKSMNELLMAPERESRSQGNAGKVRIGANHHRRGPPIQLPGYLRQPEGSVAVDAGADAGGKYPSAMDGFGVLQFDAVSDLLSWSKNLDFDEYAREWQYVGCSKPSEYQLSLQPQPALILGVNK